RRGDNEKAEHPRGYSAFGTESPPHGRRRGNARGLRVVPLVAGVVGYFMARPVDGVARAADGVGSGVPDVSHLVGDVMLGIVPGFVDAVSFLMHRGGGMMESAGDAFIGECGGRAQKRYEGADCAQNP